MTFGPSTERRSPSMPGTGSSRRSMPGRSRPTVPGRGSSRSFSAITGLVSVAPLPSRIVAPNRSDQIARVLAFTGSAPATTARSIAKCSAVPRRPQPARKVSVPSRIVAWSCLASSGIARVWSGEG